MLIIKIKSVSVGEVREMVVVHVVCVWKAVAGGRQVCGGEHYLEMC